MAEKKNAKSNKAVKVDSHARVKAVPEYKLKTVSELSRKMKESTTVLLASTRGLPSSQFHDIKKNLRGKADICVAKKSLVVRAISTTERGGLQNLKCHVGADVALFFSNLDAFELSGLLSDNQSPTKARAGDIAPEDINVEPGPTSLVPGPAISELSGVGLKVAVEGGKLAIKQPATIVRAGEVIKENVAGVMAKLDIKPMKVGFEPIAAYDSKSDKVYAGIKIDKKKAHEELKQAIGKALGFAVSVRYLVKETLSYFLAKANAEEKAVQSIIDKSQTQTTTKEGN